MIESHRTVEDFAKVLGAVRRSDAEVRFCVRCGSHVYGTARPESDQDFLLVLTETDARQDLIWGKNLNVVVHGANSYAEALANQSVFALEGVFAPKEHRLKEARPPFAYEPDLRRLFESSKARSDSDWSKAKKRFDDEPAASWKRALHSLRVLAFAGQIAEHGAIVNFEAAVPWWEEILTGPYENWNAIEELFGPKREALLENLRHGTRR